MARLIQVGNLADAVDSLALGRLFAAYGIVQSATIATHTDTGHSTGVGFIAMKSDEDGTAAIAGLNHLEHCGCVLTVCWSENSKFGAADRQQLFGPMNMMRDDARERPHNHH